MYPLVRELAAADAPGRVPVAVTCRVNPPSPATDRSQDASRIPTTGGNFAHGNSSPFSHVTA